MTVRAMARVLFAAVLAAMVCAVPARAERGDTKRGKAIYLKRCLGCHGVEGDGLGPAAQRLNPPPRDFTSGQYKFKSSAFNEDVPNDADLFRMIRDGMPGTSMPGWRDVLSEQAIWDVIAYIKVFGELEEKPKHQVDFGTQVKSSPASIKKGKSLFLKDDRCSECHGKNGKGDGVKKLKDDNGARTWPRNLTKPWTFRAGNSPKEIFTRITAGIPGTQMPSFANPKSKKKLSIMDRWHIANYVASLGKSVEVVQAKNTVVGASKLDGKLPDRPDDPRWSQAPPSTFFLVPQIIAKPRFFTPSNDTITVRAFYTDQALVLLLEWDDRTRSVPGDPDSAKIADKPMGPDAVAVQLPVKIPTGMEKPYFAMGNAAKPVNLWYWKVGTAKQPQSVQALIGRGLGKLTKRDTAAQKLVGRGVYKDGTWKVIIRRSLKTGDAANDIQLQAGRFIPVAFAAWDGSNGEIGAKHTMTTWYWLLLKPSGGGSRPLLIAILVAFVLAGFLVWWSRTAAKRRS